jgi:tRNA threonylcarbamoyladenosine biosynthesis protein TsaE
MEYTTQSAEETQRLGEKIGSSLVSENPDFEGKRIFALSGELGSGKTTFVQGFAKGLGVEGRVNSPTFILMRTYKLNGKRWESLYHVDLYRLEENIAQELNNLGISDIWQDENSIIVIEWAEKAKHLIPKEAVWINFLEGPKSQRKIEII